MNVVRVDHVKFTPVEALEDLERYLVSSLEKGKGLAIYACDSRVFYLLKYKIDEELVLAYDLADIVLADGKPLYWLLRRKIRCRHITGPGFFNHFLKFFEVRGVSQLLFGSISESCNLNFSTTTYVEAPFSDNVDDFMEPLTRAINIKKPKVVWIGLGAPKQEILIRKIREFYSDEIIFSGVGLAFNYVDGTTKRAPSWLQYLGLEWLYRYAQQPKRIRRFVKPLMSMSMRLLSVWKD